MSSAAALGLLLTACATVTTRGPGGEETVRTREEFSDYVGKVFRFENSVASNLITRYELSEDTNGGKSAELLGAEARMENSCRYLNEMVVASAEGRDPGMALKRKLQETIAACEAAAHDVAHLIGSTEQAVVLDTTPSP
jgi:hypothetical protein